MKFLLRWSAVTAVLIAPYVLVMLAGWWWLYERGYLIWWAIAAGILMVVGRWFVQRNKRTLQESPSGLRPSPGWAPADEPAWKRVEEFSERARREDWPLDDPKQWQLRLWQLLDVVAREYHPNSANPVLETPVTHIAAIVERVAHDLGEVAAQQVPGSHILTVNDWNKLQDLASRGNSLYSIYYPLARWTRLAMNPVVGLLRELHDYVSGDVVNTTKLSVKESIIDFVVQRAGFYAIELYSGRMKLPDSYVTQKSKDDAERATRQTAVLDSEPLRLLVIGQTNAGKSSLINALFGEVKAATDVLPTTRKVTPRIFDRDGIQRALIFDTAGYGAADSSDDPFADLADELLACDLVLLVSSVVTAARQADLAMLEQLRLRFQTESNRKSPPVIVVLTHIDLVRPFAEWSPPYNLAQPSNDKARRIAEAALVTADELRTPPEHVVPVCLLPERLYNVEECLLPAMITLLPEVTRAKLLRCVGMHRDEEYWRRLWRQAVNAGNLVVKGAAAIVGR